MAKATPSSGKGLNQMQKRYFVDRISTIASKKREEAGESCRDRFRATNHGGYRYNADLIDSEIRKAFNDGDLKPRPQKEILDIVGKGKVRVEIEMFFYKKDLDKLRTKLVAQAKKGEEKYQQKLEEIRKEAAILTDKVMLDGDVLSSEITAFADKKF